MIDLKDAQLSVLKTISTLTPVETSINECDGLVTARAIYAKESIPPFDNTAVDGFALNYDGVAQGIKEFEIIGTIAAGDSGDAEINNNTAARIMTGAPMPRGADCVLMVEDSLITERNGKSYLSFETTIKKFENVRNAGSDIVSGQLIFDEHTTLTAGHLGVLASLGIYSVEVYPRARVAIISTGSELTNNSSPLRPGQIRDSNRPTLSSLVRELGAIPVDFGIIPDDPEKLRKGFLEAASDCDCVLSSGGVSVGDFDYTKAVLDELSNGSMTWMQIAIRPAKPFAFGHIGTTPVFGLPGNPVSSMVSFELLARPAIKKMTGHEQLHRTRIRAICQNTLKRRPDGKTHFMRVSAVLGENGRVHIEPKEGQSSHLLYTMANSNSLAIVPDGNGISKGEEVEVIVLQEL